MTIWRFLSILLVIFMQIGFVLMENGSARAKNAGSAVMKSLFGFSAAAFFLLISGVLLEDPASLRESGTSIWGEFMLQFALCAAGVSILSGSVAERMKFSMYCLLAVVFCALIYPVITGWFYRGTGWLGVMGYVDFSRASAVHVAGGAAALIGAAMVGPRHGKYEKDEKGKVITVNAIPGNSITLSASGCFAVMLGSYGFNGAMVTEETELASIFAVTTISAVFAFLAAMVFTWLRYGKPDVYMSLNGILAGLVAISPGCASVSAVGALVIGICAGLAVCFGIWFIEDRVYVDDALGNVSIHGFCGIAGVLAVGLFDHNSGLLYGGGWKLLGVQFLGAAVICAYTAIIMFLAMMVMKKVWGLRVSLEEEADGLDRVEHGKIIAYGDFAPVVDSTFRVPDPMPAEDREMQESCEETKSSIPVRHTASNGIKYTKLSILCNPSRFEALKSEMSSIGVTGMTVTQVVGCGVQKGKTEFFRGIPVNMNLLPKLKVEIVVSTVPPEKVIEAAKRALYTGKVGDGKIFLYDVEDIVRIRTGETGINALRDPERSEVQG